MNKKSRSVLSAVTMMVCCLALAHAGATQIGFTYTDGGGGSSVAFAQGSRTPSATTVQSERRELSPLKALARQAQLRQYRMAWSAPAAVVAEGPGPEAYAGGVQQAPAQAGPASSPAGQGMIAV